MEQSASYTLDHASGTVDLALTGGRFVATTVGRGLLDRPRVINIPITDLTGFAVVPTIGIQHTVTRNVSDRSFDAELQFTYRDHGAVKRRRMFVSSASSSFQEFIAALEAQCPTASLTGLDPREAQRRLGFMSARTGVLIIVGLIVGIPVLIAIVTLAILFYQGFK